MADGFNRMIGDALAFFRELDANNNREWFAANKQRYTDEIKRPAELFISLMEPEISGISGEPVTGKLFRIHRDVRFSKDKTPYTTHLHMKWSSKAAGDGAPVWFFGIAETYATCGFGVMGLQGPRLQAYRALVDGKGDEINAAIAAGGVLSDYGPEPLKRVPKPYDHDHAHGDLLRRKSLIVTKDIAKKLKPKKADPLAVAGEAFAGFLPLDTFLRQNPF